MTTTASEPRAPRSFADLSRLDGRVALVTGATGHIGRAVVGALAELGATLAVVDLEAAACDQVAADLVARWGHPARGFATDLADESQVRDLPGRVLAGCDRIDVLVHLAALVSATPLVGWTDRFEDQDVGVWRRALEVNLTAVFALTQGCTPALRASGHGSVIITGSTYGIVGPDWRIYEGTDMGNAAGYAASKGGAVQLSRWLATTLAPDIRVNALTPGGVERGQPESFRRAYEARTPLGRMACEEDYVGAVGYLAGDLSRYVTGHNLVVDGGWTAW